MLHGRLGRAVAGVELAVHARLACCSRRWRTRMWCISSARRSPGNTPAASFRCSSAGPIAAFFAAHFPDEPPIGADGARAHQNRAFLRRMLFRAPRLGGRFPTISTGSRRPRDGDPLSVDLDKPRRPAASKRDTRGSGGGGAHAAGTGLAADAVGAQARPARPLAARHRDRGHRPRPRLRRPLERPDPRRAPLFGGGAFAAGRGNLPPRPPATPHRAGGWPRCCTTRRNMSSAT